MQENEHLGGLKYLLKTKWIDGGVSFDFSVAPYNWAIEAAK